MKLYFKCPVKDEIFGSNDYFLHKDHRIVEVGEGDRQLAGMVSLNSGCPVCGQRHSYKVKDVMCSLAKGEK